MSYTRRYSRTVSKSYSKTVSISYPASQHGGSTSQTVSGTVEIPIDIDIYVDTENFDRNVGRCCNSVTGLNAAVVATTAQEIKVKGETSKKIGDTIVKGFFDYITYELTQLKSELSAKCDSILATLIVQKDACGSKSVQMQDDYERITSRYLKLFDDLDRELSNRIKSIDEPIFTLTNNLIECSSRTTDSTLLGISTIAAAETSQLDAILSSTIIKGRARELITKINNFLTTSYYLQNSVRDLLISGNESHEYMVPVVYVESAEYGGSVQRKIYGDQAMPLKSVDDIEVELSTLFQDENLCWESMEKSDGEQIEAYFANQLNTSGLDPRIINAMVQLHDSNKINVIKSR